MHTCCHYLPSRSLKMNHFLLKIWSCNFLSKRNFLLKWMGYLAIFEATKKENGRNGFLQFYFLLTDIKSFLLFLFTFSELFMLIHVNSLFVLQFTSLGYRANVLWVVKSRFWSMKLSLSSGRMIKIYESGQ